MQQQSEGDSESRKALAEALFQRYAPTIFAFLLQQTASREDAEDILLEVFTAALEQHQQLGQFSEERQRLWLWRIARNKLIDAYRRSQRRPSVSVEQVLDDLFADSKENRLAALGYDNTVPTVKIWSTDSWMITNQYPQTTAFDWSPTGTQMALIGTDKTGQGAGSVSIVDIASGKTVRQFTDPRAMGAQAVHWSPDGSRLALENGRITIWSATNGTLLYTFPKKGAYEATWSPDSKYIGCGQTQSTINGKQREYSMLILIWVA